MIPISTYCTKMQNNEQYFQWQISVFKDAIKKELNDIGKPWKLPFLCKQPTHFTYFIRLVSFNGQHLDNFDIYKIT